MKNVFFRTKAAASELELLIYDDIGSDMFGIGLTAKAVRETIDAAGAISGITARINSRGGDTTEGFAIYQILREHSAFVTVKIDGDAHSIASIIAQAGDKRIIAPTARMMIHEARAYTSRPLKAAECDQLKSVLDQTNDAMLEVYQERTGCKADDIKAWMSAETFMGAKLSLERGFVDEISSESADQRIAAWSFDDQVDNNKNGDRQMDLATIVAALKIESTDQAAVTARIGALVTAEKERDDLILALGVDSFESAQGAIAAANVAKEEVPKLVARVEQLESVKTETERATVLADIKAAGKSTPALIEHVFPKMSTEALRAFCDKGIKVTSNSKVKEIGSEGSGNSRLTTADGRTFAQLKPMERHDLRSENPELYNSLRADALARKEI